MLPNFLEKLKQINISASISFIHSLNHGRIVFIKDDEFPLTYKSINPKGIRTMFELHDSKGGFFRVNLLDDRGNETSAKGVDIKLTSSDESVAKAEPNFDKPYLRVKVTPSGKLGQVDLTLVISDDNPDDDNQNVTLEGVLQLTIVGGPPKTISFIPEETFDLPV